MQQIRQSEVLLTGRESGVPAGLWLHLVGAALRGNMSPRAARRAGCDRDPRGIRRASPGTAAERAGAATEIARSQGYPPLLNQDVVPHTEAGPFPASIGVGGNPHFVIRAARLGFSLALAIIGGTPGRFVPYSELFRRAVEQVGKPQRPVLVHSPGHVAATDEQAKAGFWPRLRDIITVMAPERGFAIPSEESFDWEIGPRGSLYVGSPETVAQKIATTLRALDASRFDLKYGMPGLRHDQLMTNIELYGQKVIPRVRDLLS